MKRPINAWFILNTSVFQKWPTFWPLCWLCVAWVSWQTWMLRTLNWQNWCFHRVHNSCYISLSLTTNAYAFTQKTFAMHCTGWYYVTQQLQFICTLLPAWKGSFICCLSAKSYSLPVDPVFYTLYETCCQAVACWGLRCYTKIRAQSVWSSQWGDRGRYISWMWWAHCLSIFPLFGILRFIHNLFGLFVRILRKQK